MMAITQLGSRDVIETGSVVAQHNDDVLIRIGDLPFRLIFEAGEEPPNVIVHEIDSELHIRLRSFDKPLPINWEGNVAVFGGRLLNLALVVQTIMSDGPITRLVTYTFIAGRTAQ